MPDVPKQKYNVGGEFSQPIGSYTGYVNLNASHLGAVPTGFTNSAGILDIRQGSSYKQLFHTQIITQPRTVGVNLKMHF